MAFFYTFLIPVCLMALAGLMIRAVIRFQGMVADDVTIKDKLSVLPKTLLRLFHPAGLADVVLLLRSAKGGFWRYITAAFIHIGFVGLLLVHAFGRQFFDLLSIPYEPTLDPSFFLRDLFGFMLIVGVLLAVFRRLTIPRLRRSARLADWALLFVVGGITLTGFVWQGTKSLSPSAFDRMTDEYFYGGEEELEALKAVWAIDYDVVFPDGPRHEDHVEHSLLTAGRDADEASCQSCHSPTDSAFASHATAAMLRPLASSLEAVDAPAILGIMHGMFILVGIVLLPFGKIAHPLTTPLNLLLRRGRRDGTPEEDTPTAELVRDAGIAACTHCGECALRCSVAPAFDVLGIAPVLPSEKISDLSKYSRDRLKEHDRANFAVGSRICTECLRCTEVCPSGINLQDLWLSSKRRLIDEGLGGPQHDMPGKSPTQRMNALRGMPISFAEKSRPETLTSRRESYLGCVQCTTCTSVCPVVAASSNPARDLDFTPQQVMNLLRMGLVDHALGAGMTWNCVTCYKCQEHCPQGVPVADVLFELRNIANARLRDQNGKGGKR